MLFWIEVSGVPSHYKKDETFRNIGKALGAVDKVDVDGGRVRVLVNVDNPLQFERRAGFANGDVIRVSLRYEDLHRYCFTCKRISHEEGTCPELTEAQRETNRVARIEKKEKEERATREAFSIPTRYEAGRGNQPSHREMVERRKDKEDARRSPDRSRDRGSGRALYGHQSHDLRDKITERRESYSKEVWKRLEKPEAPVYPRDRERYHPYSRQRSLELRNRDEGSWRQKNYSGPPTWKTTDRRDQNGSSRDSQSLSRTSSRLRLGSPDSQRTISAPYAAHHSGAGKPRQPYRSPQKQIQEWRPTKMPSNGEERREPSGTEQDRMEHERIRKLKGKMIATEPAPALTRPLAERGTITIQEPVSNVQNQNTDNEPEKETMRKKKTDDVGNGGSRGSRSGKETGTDGTPEIIPETQEQGSLQAEGELDEENFEKMMEQYKDSEPASDEEMINFDELEEIDDLMEEEQELDRIRVEKENSIQNESHQKKGLLVMRATEEKKAAENSLRMETEVKQSTRTMPKETTRTVASDTANAEAGRRKRIPRSPDLKEQDLETASSSSNSTYVESPS
ncbi:zf-CCHC_4 domain-containing protein [Raphanus sativus]|nr:zf-CCHC_4 domain-containing protein [Raphanus sativus]